jgi:O-acetylserine/cysteine efflux transporter
MLVPIFGIASAAPLLGETVHLTDVAGGVLVVGGVLIGVLGRARPVDTPEPAGRALDRVEA